MVESRGFEPLIRQQKTTHVRIGPFYGISRSLGYELLSAGKIRSGVLRKPGNTRGCRLISADSVRTYLCKLLAEQEAEP
jgi:hypothetical protein